MAAAARRKLKGEEPLRTIDMLYTEKYGVDPNVSSNPFTEHHKATPCIGGRGRGAASDITSVTHPILDSQGSMPYPVNILLDTESLGPDGNYVHKDTVDMIDPLNKYTKRLTNSICSGLNNSCIAYSSYTNITVMLTKLV